MTDTHMPPALRFMLAARRSELAGLEGLAQTCELVTLISQWVHALQRERGYSNVYLGSKDTRQLPRLDALSAQASAVEQRVVACFDGIDLESASASDRARLFNRLAFVMHALDDLPGLRRRIRDQRLTPVEATAALTRLIGGLLAVVFEAADTAIDPPVTRVLVALFNFMQGKELAGQERAIGVNGFAAGFFDTLVRERIEHLVQGQELCFQTFAEFADDEAWRLWLNLQASDTSAQVTRLRTVALKTSESERVDPTLSQIWFDLTTARIDAMREVETRLAQVLSSTCQASIRQARADLDNHRTLLSRLVSLESAACADQALLFNVQALDLSTVPRDGLGHHLGRSVLEMLHSQTRRLLTANDERDEARQALNERKLVERAKRLLMDEYQLSEHDAYERLRVSSMERGQRMIDVAGALLELAAGRTPRRD
ncbi:nitrate regulatory protein [Pseudomonas sp. efr-133-TYG-103a]|uniref:nitrate regulatory protein n=1 Tax=Pseudomonas sp. efr-133-TYG-103a TaxID=3040308 RepID=UPI002555AE0A|nr:nitrate regulatory protein [Pseudomonas sp. efr-133-TYG-103a]